MKELIRLLYKCYDLFSLVKKSLKEKRVITWVGVGSSLYLMPAIYRYITQNPIIPYFPIIKTQTPYIPPNIFEKLIVNPIFPGGVGAVIGETIVEKTSNTFYKVKKYISRVFGSVTTTALWSLFQYIGYSISEIMRFEWTPGQNPFEPPNIYPFNMIIALTLAPLVPYAVEYVKKLYGKVRL